MKIYNGLFQCQENPSIQLMFLVLVGYIHVRWEFDHCCAFNVIHTGGGLRLLKIRVMAVGYE